MTAEPSIRPCLPTDVEALYDICLRTGAAGQDATALMEDHRLLGDLFVVPYAVLEPEHALVLDDGTGAAHGYAAGAVDTRRFEARLEAEWWPSARARHGSPTEASGLDALFLGYLASPGRARDDVVASHPSHLHIDLLPAYQGGGWGRRMMEALFEAFRAEGSPGLHLGVAEANRPALAFYERLGFEVLHTDPYTRTLGLRL